LRSWAHGKAGYPTVGENGGPYWCDQIPHGPRGGQRFSPGARARRPSGLICQSYLDAMRLHAVVAGYGIREYLTCLSVIQQELVAVDTKASKPTMVNLGSIRDRYVLTPDVEKVSQALPINRPLAVYIFLLDVCAFPHCLTPYPTCHLSAASFCQQAIEPQSMWPIHSTAHWHSSMLADEITGCVSSSIISASTLCL